MCTRAVQVIGAGIGNYDASTAVFNVADPPLRDTVTVAKGGWAAFRFLVSHPYSWGMLPKKVVWMHAAASTGRTGRTGFEPWAM